MSIPRDPGPWLVPGEKLICFGDSLTAAKNGYVKVLQEKLAPKGIEVLNKGVGGDKTYQGLVRLQRDVIDQKPDAVSLFFGANDCNIGREEWRDEPTVSPLTFQENLKWIIHILRLNGIRKFSINTLTARMEGSQFYRFGDCRTPYCQAARKAADDMNARLVPLDSVFTDLWEMNHAKRNADGLLYTVDGLHMTEEGYRIIAEAMLREWNM